MYLIQGMRHVGIDVDTRLANIGIQADALDPALIIPDEIECVISCSILARIFLLNKAYLLDSIMLLQGMVHF